MFTCKLQTMKQIITLLLLFFNLLVFANPGSGRISVSHTAAIDLRVLVDGNTYYPGNLRQTDILIENLRPGYHEVRIYSARNNRSGRQGPRTRPLYSGTVFVRPGYHVDIMMNRFGRVFVDEFPVSYNYDYPSGYGGYNDPWMDGNCRPMNGAAFGQLKASLRKIAFEDTRLSVLKQGISGNYLEVSQVRELMDLFSFEDNKMEVARECFPLAMNRQQYYSLQDAFSFDSNKSAFLKIMQ